ncbi:MAG TPA: hybrid sensor histidine kinase/response regulator [Verrucomicrobiae bacterium]|nr:hybrid sensor histidine kinase/response regulator [Verrucomicrobiae bacterium]
MSTVQDYKKFAILYVDDEEKSLKAFARAFEDQFWILTAASAQEGLKLLEQHQDEIGLLMTDQRMPGEQGVWLLEKARQLRPRIVRVMATAYADLDAVIAAVNTGSVYKYVSKPWDPPQLEMTLKRGLEFFMVQRERDQLLKEKMAVLQHMMVADRVISLGLLAAGLSHHIRNSLVAVKTFLDLAPVKLQEEKIDMDGLRNPEFWKEYYQNVQGQVEKINDLLKDLWLASEKPPFHFTDQIRLDEMVPQLLEKMKPGFAAKGLQVENQIPDNLPPLLVDKPKFIRLFELLLKDELVSLPAGSKITISASALPESTPQRREIQVEIRDDGPGLPQEALRVIFDPFVVRTDSPQEYGISLMACYFIIHHHGGKIEARNTEPHGTVFTLRLLADPNQPPLVEENRDFLQKALLNDTMWDKLVASE